MYKKNLSSVFTIFIIRKYIRTQVRKSGHLEKEFSKDNPTKEEQTITMKYNMINLLILLVTEKAFGFERWTNKHKINIIWANGNMSKTG
jgi:hypothetical protein